MTVTRPIIIATRGSALAMVQAHQVLRLCQDLLPEWTFEISIIKTTGDKLQSASLANPNPSLPKGLFTKELEMALLNEQADLAVHSLKDLPTELPAGLKLGAVCARADIRDVLLYRPELTARLKSSGLEHEAAQETPKVSLANLPQGAVIATSSARRKAQLLARRADLRIEEIRGNVGTRLRKLVDNHDIDGTILAAAGLNRLNFRIDAAGYLRGEGLPEVCAALLTPEEMLPSVGQGAIGIESREDDSITQKICERLNHVTTFECVEAERSFLRAMGGGCQSPVAAYAQIAGTEIHLRAVSFMGAAPCYAERRRKVGEAILLGQELAQELKG
jgi:hydroxymethylbilane synthase